MAVIRKNIVQLSYFIFSTTFIFIVSCNNFKKNHSHESVPDSNIAKGKVLAATYCQSCHMLPDPSLLDAKTWEHGVLPGMGPRLGIFDYGLDHYPSSRNDMNLARNFYPAKPVVSTQEWQYIIDYYASVSPDSLPQQQRKYPVKKSLSLFNIEIPAYKNHLPTTCFVQLDTVSLPSRQVIISDMITKNIFRFDNQLQLLDTFKNSSPVVAMEIHQRDIIACNIGVMNPNDGKDGSAVRISTDPGGKMKVDSNMRLNNLARPVQVSSADFNRDGKTDYLVCEFGNLTGALSWMENLGNNKYERHLLRGFPGAIKAYIRDVNHDGLPDIWALFAQGDE
ncbi:MAG: hypothetical protein NVS3B8_13340 [Chitinophagaceae bacterium]